MPTTVIDGGTVIYILSLIIILELILKSNKAVVIALTELLVTV